MTAKGNLRNNEFLRYIW